MYKCGYIMNITLAISKLFNKEARKENELLTGNQKILIVDDTAENRLLLELILKKAGLNTISCKDGTEAVEIVKNNDIALILMDIYMTTMDGIEATRIIKNTDRLQPIPIIAVTAANSDKEKQQRIDVGVNDYVLKPVEPVNLLKRIAKQLEFSAQMESVINGSNILSTYSNDRTYKKAIKIFVKSLPSKIKKMEEAFNNADFEELTRCAHSLKGTGGMVGFNAYSEKAAELEKHLKSDSPEHSLTQNMIDNLKNMAKRTKKTCK